LSHKSPSSRLIVFQGEFRHSRGVDSYFFLHDNKICK
jgi:hypothetical protein